MSDEQIAKLLFRLKGLLWKYSSLLDVLRARDLHLVGANFLRLFNFFLSGNFR